MVAPKRRIAILVAGTRKEAGEADLETESVAEADPVNGRGASGHAQRNASSR